MEENQSNQGIDFIKEKVKERPLNKRKLIKRTLLTASMAVIFGLIACLTFLVLEPVFTNLLYPEEEPELVQLREEDVEDEMLPEDMILSEAAEGEQASAGAAAGAQGADSRGGISQGSGSRTGAADRGASGTAVGGQPGTVAEGQPGTGTEGQPGAGANGDPGPGIGGQQAPGAGGVSGSEADRQSGIGGGGQSGTGTGAGSQPGDGSGGQSGTGTGAGSQPGGGSGGQSGTGTGMGGQADAGGNGQSGQGIGGAAEPGTAGEGEALSETEAYGSEAAEGSAALPEKAELEMSDYQRLYRLMYALVQRNSQSMVTVTGVVTDMDWFDNIYENQGQASGLIVADNGIELLILTDNTVVESAESLLVTFHDDVQTSAQIKGQDKQTGLAILSVLLEEIPEETRETLTMAVLGSSATGLLAMPVIAVGRPLGSASSIVYGMVTSSDSRDSFVDHNVRLLTTDMMGTDNSSGVLINLSGQVIGIIRPMSLRGNKETSLITAYGITDLRLLIEKLSNGVPIPYMGVMGSDVPVEIHAEMGVPMGAYVTNIEMDSPAMKAGIQSGDVIVELNGTEIRSFSEYQEALFNLAPETGVTVKMMRQGAEEYQEMTVDVILEEAK